MFLAIGRKAADAGRPGRYLPCPCSQAHSGRPSRAGAVSREGLT